MSSTCKYLRCHVVETAFTGLELQLPSSKAFTSRLVNLRKLKLTGTPGAPSSEETESLLRLGVEFMCNNNSLTYIDISSLRVTPSTLGERDACNNLILWLTGHLIIQFSLGNACSAILWSIIMSECLLKRLDIVPSMKALAMCGMAWHGMAGCMGICAWRMTHHNDDLPTCHHSSTVHILVHKSILIMLHATSIHLTNISTTLPPTTLLQPIFSMSAPSYSTWSWAQHATATHICPCCATCASYSTWRSQAVASPCLTCSRLLTAVAA